MKRFIQSRLVKVVLALTLMASLSLSFASLGAAEGSSQVGSGPEYSSPLVQGLIAVSQNSENNPNLDQPEGYKSPFLEAVLNGSYNQTGDQVEIDFMTFMLVHHEVAVKMAQMCIDRAVHQDLKSLCQSIATSQAIQITQMNFYLAEHFQLYQAPTELEQDEFIIKELEPLQGAAFEEKWLELMPPHHSQAIVTAKVCAAGATHVDVKTLCQAIVYAQSSQLPTMANMLQQWYGKQISTDPMTLAQSIENIPEAGSNQPEPSVSAPGAQPTATPMSDH